MHQNTEEGGKYQIQMWREDLHDWMRVQGYVQTIKQAENIVRFMGEANTLYHKRLRILDLLTFDVVSDMVVTCRVAKGDEPSKMFPIPDTEECVKAVFEWHNVQ